MALVTGRKPRPLKQVLEGEAGAQGAQQRSTCSHSDKATVTHEFSGLQSVGVTVKILLVPLGSLL